MVRSFWVLAVILLVVSGCRSESGPPAVSQSEVREQLVNEITRLLEFRDPETARFRNEGFAYYDVEASAFVEGFEPRASAYVFCGLVSGLNQFGARSGYKPFVANYFPPAEAGAEADIEIVFQENSMYPSYAQDCP